MVRWSIHWFFFNEYGWSVNWDPGKFYAMFGSTPSYYYVSNVTNWEGWPSGSAAVYNPYNVIGSSDDGQYTRLYAGSYGSTARIWTTLNGQTSGRITIKGYSAINSQSYLLVYRSMDNNNWYLVRDQTVFGNSPYWIDIGYTSVQFRYLLIVIYNNVQGTTGDLYIDAVRVFP